VVIFSADATERQIKRLLGAGARAYLTKPAKVGDFLRMLDDVFEPGEASSTSPRRRVTASRRMSSTDSPVPGAEARA
jgi:DNA-binding NarL/FixJ family response regulator